MRDVREKEGKSVNQFNCTISCFNYMHSLRNILISLITFLLLSCRFGLARDCEKDNNVLEASICGEDAKQIMFNMEY